jgi:hypothetical protein
MRICSPIRLYKKNYGKNSIIGIPEFSTGYLLTDRRILNKIVANKIPTMEKLIECDLAFQTGDIELGWMLFLEGNSTNNKPIEIKHLFAWLHKQNIVQI